MILGWCNHGMQNRGYRESAHMEEMHIWRADNQLYSDSQLCRQSVPLTPHCSRVNCNLLHQGQPDCASELPGAVPVSGLHPRDADVVGLGWGLGTHFLDAPLVGLVDVRVLNHHTCTKCLPPVTSFRLHSLAGGALRSPLNSPVKLQSYQCPPGLTQPILGRNEVQTEVSFHFTLLPMLLTQLTVPSLLSPQCM